ncbi:hypothetical protein ABT369_09180 [Dactylosporangium sp. NPDC000244]|uniref:hypothetical protein n=1 Tax=Dactylosporangium sp. NPDC000244 TaxID=3154365 RepID=UPI0033319C38
MTDNAWVFPVGHYLGTFFPAAGAPLQAHRVRVGRSVTSLYSDQEFAVWALAHGLAGPADERPWTCQRLAAAAREQSGADVTRIVAELLEERVLVEAAPELLFARTHRFQALLSGLGTDPRRPDSFQLGLAGQPLAAVDELAFEIWQWAPRQPTIWATCELLATADGVAVGRPADPDAMLAPVLDRLHTLLSAGAGYLDVA